MVFGRKSPPPLESAVARIEAEAQRFRQQAALDPSRAGELHAEAEAYEAMAWNLRHDRRVGLAREAAFLPFLNPGQPLRKDLETYFLKNVRERKWSSSPGVAKTELPDFAQPSLGGENRIA